MTKNQTMSPKAATNNNNNNKRERERERETIIF
jgi:hypothetical protein